MLRAFCRIFSRRLLIDHYQSGHLLLPLLLSNHQKGLRSVLPDRFLTTLPPSSPSPSASPFRVTLANRQRRAIDLHAMDEKNFIQTAHLIDDDQWLIYMNAFTRPDYWRPHIAETLPTAAARTVKWMGANLTKATALELSDFVRLQGQYLKRERSLQPHIDDNVRHFTAVWCRVHVQKLECDAFFEV